MNFELVSMWAERYRSIFILLYVEIQYSQHLLISYLFSRACFWLYCQNLDDCSRVCLPYCSIILSAHQSKPASRCPITTALHYIRSAILLSPALLFLPTTDLATQRILPFHLNFSIDYSISVENAIGISVGSAINTQITVSAPILTTVILPFHDH